MNAAWHRFLFSCLIASISALQGCAVWAPNKAQSPAALMPGSPPQPGAQFVPQPQARAVWKETFERLNPKQWREVEVTGNADYRVINLEGRRCLEAFSNNNASIMLHSINADSAASPWLAWQWRIERFVGEEDLYRKEKSDASARVYVYFDTPGLPWQKHSIDYVWSVNLPVDTLLDSPYSSASKIIVATSGSEKLGQWQQAQRNLVDDYRRAFNAKPPKIRAIGLMTDTDSAGGQALAYYDDVQLLTQSVGP